MKQEYFIGIDVSKMTLEIAIMTIKACYKSTDEGNYYAAVLPCSL